MKYAIFLLKSCILTTTILCGFFPCNAQTITFQKTYGGNLSCGGNSPQDQGWSVQPTSDGGYIIGGNTTCLGANIDDVYLIKTDSLGDTLWTKTFGAVDDQYVQGNMSVQQTADGGYVIVGYSLINTPSPGPILIYLIKTDSSGNLLWSETLGAHGSTTKNNYANSVQQTTDGGFIIGGSTSGYGAGLWDLYLIKTDISGGISWTKTFGGTDNEPSGYPVSVRQTTDGGYVIAGVTKSFGAQWIDVYVVKTDSAGNHLWSKQYGGSGVDVVNSIQQTTDGGYILSGYTDSTGAGQTSAFLIKTDTIGDTLWTKKYKNNNSYCIAASARQTNDGGYIFTGETFINSSSVSLLVKTDANGDTLWVRTFPASRGSAVQQTIDNGFVVTGWRQQGITDTDVLLIKTDSDGNSVCNQSSVTLTIANPLFTVAAPATQTGTGGSTGSIATTIGSGGTVTDFTAPQVIIISVNVSCNGGSNGAATANGSGGTTPYSYLWSNGQTAQTATELVSGTYTVTISDAGSCTVTALATVTEPAAISVTTSSVAANCGQSDGSATVNAIGGNAPYAYQWQNGQTAQTATGLPAGTYSVTITDSSSCTQTAIATVNNTSAPALTISTANPICNGENNGTATANATGGTSPYNFNWSNGQITQSATGLPAGNYTVTVTDATGCIIMTTATISEPPLITGDIITPDTTISIGVTVQLYGWGSGSNFLWSPAQGLSCTSCQNPSANPNATTTYYLTVSDANGCSSIDSVTITVKKENILCGEIFIPNIFSPNNDGTNDKLFVHGNCIKELYFTIYDRWGEKVFETTDQSVGWGGTYKNKMMNTAVFVYYAKGTFTNNDPFYRQGTITLVR